MRSVCIATCCLVLFGLATPQPSAAETLFDNTTDGFLMCEGDFSGGNCDSGTWRANNFTPLEQWDISSIDVYGWYVGLGGLGSKNEFWLEIWSDNGGPDSVVWALPVADRFELPEDEYGQVSVMPSTSVPTLAADTTYWLVMGSDYGGSVGGAWQFADPASTDGSYYNHPPGGGVMPYGWAWTSEEPAFRLEGQSYEAGEEDDSPEPGTWVLLLATGAVGGLLRRRRKDD